MAITASELRANTYKLLDQVLETGTPQRMSGLPRGATRAAYRDIFEADRGACPGAY